MSTWLQDLRFALRMMTKSPGFTAIAILTLALGIGANSATFSVVNAAMIRPLPFPNAAKLVDVYHSYTKLNLAHVTVSPASYQYIRDNSKAFEQFAAFTGFRSPQNMTGSGEPQRVRAVMTTWNLFDVLGSKPMLGRTFVPADDTPGTRVAILGYTIWRDKFGGDRGIVGKEITLDNANYQVIGVMPKNFNFPPRGELYVPLGMSAKEMADGGAEYLNAVGKLRDGVTRAQLDDDMRRMTAEQLRKDNETANPAGWSVGAKPLQEMAVSDMRTALWVLLSAVGCVLLIACANVANLLLVRATARQKEIAIRTALGASRWRLVRQLLTEGALLGLVGALLGMGIAYWSLDALIALVPVQIPSYIEIKVDTTVMLFTIILGVVTGLFFSALPALQVTGGDTNEILKQGGRSAAGAGSPRVRGAIVALQLAFAVVLLISAGLLIKTFVRIQQSNMGFDPEHILTAGLGLPEQKYAEPVQRINFYSQLLERLQATPGVKSAAINVSLPLTTAWTQSFNIEGKTFDVRPHAHVGVASRKYFETMRIPILSGRTFTDADNTGTQPVVIIDTNIARAYFGDENPIGKRLLLGMPGFKDNKTPFEIVGVVGAVKHTSPYQNETKGQFYVPYTQVSIPSSMIVVRTDGDPMALASSLRQAVLAIDPSQPLEEVRPMEEVLNEFVAQPRFNMLLIGIFASLALLLSAIGVYGVMAYSVTQRTHEIGVRMALGAQRANVMGMILSQAAKLALIGLAIGIVGAFVATKALASMLFGVRPADPMTFVGITALLAAITMIAGLMPALRATRIDPLVALRYE